MCACKKVSVQIIPPNLGENVAYERTMKYKERYGSGSYGSARPPDRFWPLRSLGQCRTSSSYALPPPRVVACRLGLVSHRDLQQRAGLGVLLGLGDRPARVEFVGPGRDVDCALADGGRTGGSIVGKRAGVGICRWDGVEECFDDLFCASSWPRGGGTTEGKGMGQSWCAG